MQFIGTGDAGIVIASGVWTVVEETALGSISQFAIADEAKLVFGKAITADSEEESGEGSQGNSAMMRRSTAKPNYNLL